MLTDLIQKLVGLGIEQARDSAIESTLEKSSVTVTKDWLNGPKNTLPPLLPFLPSNRAGKRITAGIISVGAIFCFATFGFTGDALGAIFLLWIFAYGLYAFVYGGTCLQSPPALTGPKVFHFLGWKARLIGLIFIALSGLGLWFASSG